MQVENWKIEDVKPYENNPRNNDDAVEYVANSIKEFGFQQPLVVDSEGVLIVGHTRLKAAELLGLETVPVVVAGDLTDEQVRAYRLADNKTGEKAYWDFGKLDLELGEIDWLDINMEEFGFTIWDKSYDAPEDVDEDELLEKYEGLNDALETKRVIICFKGDEEEQKVRQMLGLSENDKLNVVYNVKDINV